MATLLHSDSRRLYSWWWDSHISPKTSKWLQENLTDMDTKVKSMIKLIEEDADSFARRAEMYYKKRPELMKLVEEFYRAYRALAERYDHATVELRQAHRTMAEAFPNQVPYLADDSSSVSSGPEVEPHTPEMPHPVRAFFDPEDLQKDALGLSSTCSSSTRRHNGYSDESDYGTKKRGLKQLNDMFGSGTAQRKVAEGRMEEQEADGEKSLQSGFSQLSTEYKTLKTRALSESERACKAESEIQALKKVLADLQAEKEAVNLQFQESLQKISSLERELNHAQIDAGGLNERAIKAEIEIEILKEALIKLEAERDAALLQYNQCLAKISILEMTISEMQEETKGLNERALIAEIEGQNLNQELSRLHDEKEAGLLQYKQCLETISALKNKIVLAEENAQMLTEQNERAETEVKALKQELYKLKEEKEDAVLQYKRCLDTIGKLESEIARAQENSERLNRKIVVGEAKLKSVEEQHVQLEKSNQSLQLEAENLAQKIAVKDQELFEKQNELEKLQSLLQDEESRFSKIETTLKSLQLLHSQSQEEQKSLTLELQNRLQMLKNLEVRNQSLEDDILLVKQENQTLNEQNKSSTISLKILQSEISSLKEMKEKLKEEVTLQVNQSIALQEEVYRLQEEIKYLNRRYQVLMEQVQSAGLNPEFIESSVKNLQNENSKLIEVCNRHRDEKDALYEKLRQMDCLLQKKSVLESSLSESNAKLEGSREKVVELQESCQFLRDEKSALIAEKASLLSQLQIMTENMQKLLERNVLLETSLSGANVELEGLRVKSKNFEEFCQLLKNEKSDLLNERSLLVSELKNVEEILGNLENRFVRLEEKCADLEKEKESTNFQVEELRSFLCLEKQERASYVQSSESRLTSLEKHVHLLQEECRSGKREFEEELDKAVKAQVEIFILQKFIEDLENKNLSLLVDCQKHIEASKLSDKLISELESENLEQQVEAEFFLDEIENLRAGIYKVFRALQFDADCNHEDKIQQEESRIPYILADIEELKCSYSRNEDEKQQVLVENSVLLCLLQQLRLEGAAELESEKKIIENDFQIITEHHTMLQKDNNELLEMNRQLKLEVREGHQQESMLKGDLKAQHAKLGSLKEAYLALQEENSKALEENRLLVKQFSELRKEMCILEEENGAIFQEVVALSNISLIFQSFGTEKEKEIKAFAKDLNGLQVVNSELKQKVEMLGEKLDMRDAENRDLDEKVEKLHKDLDQADDVNGQLNYQILMGQDFLRQKAVELLEAQQKLEVTQHLNAELCKTIEELKRECERSKIDRGNIEKQVHELIEFRRNQKEEIEQLNEMNKNLKSEVWILHKEVEEQRVREEHLSSELQEKSNEFELWEAEAASFYFDLQISSFHEVLLENKVIEFTGLCQSLENESAAKSVEIEQMKEKVGSLESEIGGLKAQLSAYVPIIASLKDTVESLEHKVLRTKSSVAANEELIWFFPLDLQLDYQHHTIGCQELEKERITTAANGISSLQEMQTRIRVIETAVAEERDRLAVQTVTISVEEGGLVREPDKVNLRNTSEQENAIQKEEMELENELTDKLRWQRPKPEISEMKNGLLMKDIGLDHISNSSSYGRSRKENEVPDDQMLELWESAEQDYSIDCIVSDTEKQANPHVESGAVIHQFKDAEHKSRDLCSELQVEKELGVDKIEVSESFRDQNQGGRGKKILERLASDAQKLVGLQRAVQGLKKEIETKKRLKKANKVEYDRVKGQLQEAEEAIVQLADVNDQLAKDIEESISFVDGKNFAQEKNAKDISRKIAMEQAGKGSEKIGRLQFEVQSIQYLLLKLEDEKKHKGKNKFSESKPGVLLRDFIYKGNANSARRKKACFCGCMRSSEE